MNRCIYINRIALARKYSECKLTENGLNFYLGGSTMLWCPNGTPKYIKTANSGSCIFASLPPADGWHSIVVTEGIFDALAIRDSIPNVWPISVLGSSINQDLVDILLGIAEDKPITLAFDNDSAGMQGMLKAHVKWPDTFNLYVVPTKKDWYDDYYYGQKVEFKYNKLYHKVTSVDYKYTRALNSVTHKATEDWYKAATNEIKHFHNNNQATIKQGHLG